MTAVKPTAEDYAQWLERKLATNDDTNCAVGLNDSSCLCCGRQGKPKAWLAAHPEVYVCERCWLASRRQPESEEAYRIEALAERYETWEMWDPTKHAELIAALRAYAKLLRGERE